MPAALGPDYYASRQAWIMVGSILGAATFTHVYRLASNWHQRQKLLVSYRDPEDRTDIGVSSSRIKFGKMPAAISTTLNNLFHLWTLPLWIYSSTTLAELLLTTIYTGMMLMLSFYNTWSASKGTLNFANQCGVMAFSQVILIVGLAGKNNTISFLSGISYQKLNFLHRASARVALLLSWIHSIERIRLGLTRDKVITLPYVQWGVIALIAFTIVYISSFRFVRHMYYEAFLFLHLIFVLLFLIGAYMHYPLPLGYWIWPAFLLWGLDRLVRFGKYLFNHKLWRVLYGTSFASAGDCTVELLEGGVMRLTVKRVGLKWSAGQHGYISIPSLSRLPRVPHPFSYASLAADKVEDRDAIFLIRTYAGFTQELANKIASDHMTNIPAYLEGPYGTSHSLTHNSTVLLIAGGTGITFILSHFLQLLSASPGDKSAVRILHLVWNVRHASHVTWIVPMLNKALESFIIPPMLRVKIDIHVTRSLVSSEPETSGEGAGGLSGKLRETIGHVLPNASDEEVVLDEKVDGLEGQDGYDQREESEVMFAQDLSFGLSAEGRRLITFNAGRADIEGIIEKDVASSRGPMNVTVCGPTELSLDTRRAVAKVATADRVLRGQHQIEFYHETFGW